MLATWQARLTEAELQLNGPSILTQLLEAAGITWRPNRRRLLTGLALSAVLLLIVLVAVIVAAVVFWPELQPVVQFFLGRGAGGGD